MLQQENLNKREIMVSNHFPSKMIQAKLQNLSPAFWGREREIKRIKPLNQLVV